MADPPRRGDIFTILEGSEAHALKKSNVRRGYQVRSVDTNKHKMEVIGIGTDDIFETTYNKDTGGIFGYERVRPIGPHVRIGGKKKSRNKSRKNKRKTMRRNKFMKWF